MFRNFTQLVRGIRVINELPGGSGQIIRPRLDDRAHTEHIKKFLWLKCLRHAVDHPDEVRIDEYFATIWRARFVHPADLSSTPVEDFQWTAELIDGQAEPHMGNLQAISRRMYMNADRERRFRTLRSKVVNQ